MTKLQVVLRALATGTAMCAATIVSGQAWAQDAGAAEGGAQQSSPNVIVVTAQRREQGAQEIPIAVSALSSEDLESANIEEVADVRRLVPSLTLTVQGGNVIQPFLRGVGNPAVAVGNEASAAIYIDGVYFSRLPAPLFQLDNIERVEVLKGPQGTLFGRNSTGGLIQIVTRDPSPVDSVLHASIGYANYDTISGSLYASTPLSENLAADISVDALHQGDGWGMNLDTGDEAFLTEHLSIRSKWRYEGPSTTVTLTGTYVTSDYADTGFSNSNFFGSGSFHRDPLPPHDILPYGDFYDVTGEYPQIGSIDFYGGSLRIEQDVGFAQAVSISAINHLDGYAQFDADFSPVQFFYLPQPYTVDQISQELQLLSNPGSSFEWIVGLYYLHLDSQYNDLGIQGIFIGGTGDSNARVNSQSITNSYSAYGQATFDIGSNTQFSIGARYTRDELSANGITDFIIPSLDVFVPGVLETDSVSFEKFTWRLALEHELAPDIRAYISQSRGFKSGIYNILPFSTTPAQPEVIDATEIGIKTLLFDGQLRLNAALFHYHIDSPQVNIYPPGAPGIQLINAGSAEVNGIEIEGAASIGDLTITFGGTYLDATYTDFTNAPFYFQGQYPASGGPADPYSADATGNHLPQAPEFTGNIGVSYDIESSIGRWTIGGNYYYNSGVYFHPDNYLHQESYGLFNAQVRLVLPDERWSFRLWARNITGEEYYVGADQQGSYPGHSAVPGAPRTYGLTVEYNLN